MGYISKYNLSFLTLMQRKYIMYHKVFKYIDDYLLFLYEEYCHKNTREYYKQLEQDIIFYSNRQTGVEREQAGKLDGSWYDD